MCGRFGRGTIGRRRRIAMFARRFRSPFDTESQLSFSSIIAEAAGGVHRITLNRPDRLNSFTDAMHAELREALGAVKADAAARVLVITGAGRGFCAGQDLGDRTVEPGAAPPDLGETIGRNYLPLVHALRALPL